MAWFYLSPDFIANPSCLNSEMFSGHLLSVVIIEHWYRSWVVTFLWFELIGTVVWIPIYLLTCTGLFKMIVGVLTTCHTQYTWDRSICIFLFNRTTLQVFVTYLTGAVYVHPSWFYKHQYENRVRSKLFVACQRWCFQWLFWFVLCSKRRYA